MKLIKDIKIKFFCLIITFCLLYLNIFGGVCFAEPGIKITKPLNGSTVNPGEEITITIEALDGFEPQDGVVHMGGSPLNERVTSLPLTFTDKIPKEAVAKASISVAARSVSGKIAFDDVTLNVQQTATVQSLKAGLSELYFETDWNGNPKDNSYPYIGSVYGEYSDGVERDLTKDANTTFASSDPSVISIDNTGKFQVHKVGNAKIIISNSGLSVDIPVTFIKPRGIKPSETIPPTAQIDIQPQTNAVGWYNQDITITITGQDNEGGSGVDEIIYEFPYLSAESIFVPGSQAVIPFSKEGINLFRYAVYDKARNNSGQQSLEIKLDKTPPTIVITSPEDKKEYFQGETIPITYAVEDALSGVQTKTVTLDGIDVSSQTAITPKAGSHTLTITAVDKAGNSATKQVTFITKIKAQVIIKPEIFLCNRGVFIAIVRLPREYQRQRIIEATCEGAPAKKMIPTPKGTIIVFKRQDITEQPLDTTFTVKGKLQNGFIFEGSYTIKKIVYLENLFDHSVSLPQDRANEEAELDNAIDELYGTSTEGKETEQQIRLINN